MVTAPDFFEEINKHDRVTVFLSRAAVSHGKNVPLSSPSLPPSLLSVERGVSPAGPIVGLV